jgi:hypothetical protein
MEKRLMLLPFCLLEMDLPASLQLAGLAALMRPTADVRDLRDSTASSLLLLSATATSVSLQRGEGTCRQQ